MLLAAASLPAAPGACTAPRAWRRLQQQERARAGRPAAASSDNDGVRPAQLDMAASNFAKGLMEGADEDELVARQLGAASAAELGDVKGRYADAVKRRLEERAEELRREREARTATFARGKAAYARGQYPASAALLEAALAEEGPFTQLGGEVQLWLALAYQACGREDDCLATYRALEKTHPLPAIRRRAADLRYIMEAPRLQVGPDERVQIPVPTDMDVNRGNRTPMTRLRPRQKRQVPKTWDEEFWDNYEGPRVATNRYVWAAASIAATAVAVYSSAVQRGLVR